MNNDKLDLFISQTRSDITEIKSDVKSLLEYRWKLEGKILGASMILSVVIAFAMKLILG